jgi:DNA-binding response OmpR family regulator
VKVILITGYAQQQRRAHNLDLLIDDVVSKPFTADELMSVVKRVLASALCSAPGRTVPN